MMKDTLLKIYHRCPPPLRIIAASLRGYYLRSWRYGHDTDARMAVVLARDQWTAEQWQAYQQERLACVLRRAATQVPFYRQQWEQRRRNGDRASWEMLENWPALEKEALRAHARAFIADDCHIRHMFHEHTSGTSGMSLDLWWSRDTVREWYALTEVRWRHWYRVSRADRWAMLGGQLVTPVAQKRPPFWVWNRALNQLYMSSYHLSPALIPHYLDALQKYRIQYLWGYPSSLYALADAALRQGYSDLHFRVAITNAEPVYDYQRQAIETAFHCPVRETYGMAEIVAAAGECASHQLHLWPEVGIVEVFAGNDPVTLGQSGDLVCTGLLNTDMPLIRYRVGDRGALPAENIPCSCGSLLPRLQSIEGRIDDVLYTRDGRCIGRLDPAFKTQLPVREAQIIQESLDQIRVRFVPAHDFTPATEAAIARRLRERMGDVQVIFEAVTQIPRTANGKFRTVICNLSPEEKAQFRQ